MIFRILIASVVIMAAWLAFNWIRDEQEVRGCEQQHLQMSGYINEGVSFYCREK